MLRTTDIIIPLQWTSETELSYNDRSTDKTIYNMQSQFRHYVFNCRVDYMFPRNMFILIDKCNTLTHAPE